MEAITSRAGSLLCLAWTDAARRWCGDRPRLRAASFPLSHEWPRRTNGRLSVPPSWRDTAAVRQFVLGLSESAQGFDR